MSPDEFLNTLTKYRDLLQDILSRFTKGRDSIHIDRQDDPIYRQTIQEIIDFIDDNLGQNQYSNRIADHFNDGIANFTQSPSYKSVENIIGVLGAVITRISRNPELIKKIQDGGQKANSSLNLEKKLKFTEKVTLSWLWQNVPASIWLKFIGVLVFVFILGLYTSGIPNIKNLLRHVPGLKIDLVVPPETRKSLEQEVTSLIKAHNERLAELQKQLLNEEQLGADHDLIGSYREYHQEAAQRLREIIRAENGNFQKELNALKSLLE